MTGAEVDKLVETRGLSYVDAGKYLLFAWGRLDVVEWHSMDWGPPMI